MTRQTVRRAPETQMSHPSDRVAAGAFWAIWPWASHPGVRVAPGAVWAAGAVVGASNRRPSRVDLFALGEHDRIPVALRLYSGVVARFAHAAEGRRD